MIETIQDFFFIHWVVVLMVERVAVNHYVGGSNPSFPANLFQGRQAVCQHAVNVSDFGGSNPSLGAKSLTERAYIPPVVQVVTLSECNSVGRELA